MDSFKFGGKHPSLPRRTGVLPLQLHLMSMLHFCCVCRRPGARPSPPCQSGGGGQVGRPRRCLLNPRAGVASHPPSPQTWMLQSPMQYLRRAPASCRGWARCSQAGGHGAGLDLARRGPQLLLSPAAGQPLAVSTKKYSPNIFTMCNFPILYWQRKLFGHKTIQGNFIKMHILF